MSNEISHLLSQGDSPLTARQVAERLPHFSEDIIAAALETLAGQGVLQVVSGSGETAAYRYADPKRYAQIHLDVVRDPAAQKRGRG